jgi:serine phosphatase RsbU (regulator of sigma subunit)
VESPQRNKIYFANQLGEDLERIARPDAGGTRPMLASDLRIIFVQIRMEQFYKLCFYVLIFSGCCGTIAAQENRKIDSLNKIIHSNRADTLRVNAWNELSIIYRANGDLDSANYLALQAFHLSEKINYSFGQAKALYYMGVILYVRGSYVHAMDTLTKAADIFKSLGDKKYYSSVLTVMGGVKNSMGDLPGALNDQLEALKIKEEIGDSANIAAALNNIGNVYLSTYDYEKALSFFKRALVMNIRYKLFSHAADNYYSIGNIYNELDNDSLAKINVYASIRISDSIHSVEGLSYAYGLLGGIKAKEGDIKGAVEYYTKAIAIADKMDDKRLSGSHYQHLGVMYQELGDKKKAEQYLLYSLALADTIDDLENSIASHRSLSNLYTETGDYQKALFHYKKFKDEEDTLFNQEKQNEMTRKEMNYEFEKKRALEKLQQDKKDALANEESKRQEIVIYAVSILLVLVIIFFFFLYNRFLITRKQKAIIAEQKTQVEIQRDQVNLQNAIIQEKNKSITDSINYAQRIQMAILPDDELFHSFLPDAFIFFQPKDIVSGDFYWITELGDFIFYATADSTGHGVPGGFMSVLGASLLNEVVNEKKVTEPAAILDLMKAKIIGALKQKGETGENKDGMEMVICRLNKKTKELSFAAANNPLWLVRDGKLTEYKADKQSVGIGSENEQPFSQHSIALKPNDIIYTITDGFADQFGGTKGKKFKYKPLQELLVSISHEPMKRQSEMLRETFVMWQGNLEQVDDVLVIGVKI